MNDEIRIRELEQKNLALRQQLEQSEEARSQLESVLAKRTADLSRVVSQLEQETCDREQSDTALAESEARFRMIATTIPGAVFQFSVRDGQWAMDYMSDRVHRIIGVTAAEIMNDLNCFTACIHPDDRERHQEAIETAIANLTPWHFEGRVIKADNTVGWWQGDATPTMNEASEIIFCGVLLDISDRKQSEEKLRHSQQKLSLLFQQTPLAIIEWNANREVQEWNPAAERIFGYKRQEAIGRSFGFLIPDAIRQDVSQRLDKLNQHQQAGSAINENLTKDGRIITCEWYNVPLIASDGQIVGSASLAVDISDRKHAEAKLEEQEQFLRSIFDGIQEQIFVIDVLPLGEFRYAGWNWFAETITNITSSQAVGKTPEEVFGEIDAIAVRQRYGQCITANETVSYEECLLFLGEPRWWLTTLNPLKDESGRIYRIVGTSLDIGDRKQAETKLQEREEFLRSIFEGVQQDIFVVNVTETGDLRFGGWNWYSDKMIGMKSADAVGKTPEDVFGIELGTQVRQQFSQCLKLRSKVTYEEHLTFENHSVWLLTTLNPQFDEAGRLYRFVGTAVDISDRKQAEALLHEKSRHLEQTLAELQHAQTQLIQSEKMSSLGQLVAGVAHEINNPVNFIHGNLSHAHGYTQDLIDLVELYQTHVPNPPAIIQATTKAIDLDFLKEDLPKVLSSMKVGSERIREIVRSLRSFSRLDEAEFKAVDIHDGIDSTLMILQSRLKSKSGNFSIQVLKKYGTLPLVDCYPGQLNQVLMNILSNAIDALEEASLKAADPFLPLITISTAVLPTRSIAIQIADNGAGMNEQVRSRLFDPFFTTKTVGKGTGLGLSISYQIVTEKHKGRLTCQSTPQQGAKFIIEIPIHQTSSKG